MTKSLSLLILSLLAMNTSFAQFSTNYNMFWAFGSGGAVNFVSGSPVATTSGIAILEGSASLCDASGNLLFYTDGKKVWDRTNTVMPSGASIVTYSTFDAAQGAQIVPVIGTPNQYYIFSGDVYLTGRLAHSIVDMSLHGGLGDVVTASSGIVMGADFAEKMIAVQGNSCNVWLITHRRDSATFWVYNITSAGISAPVISNVGTLSAYNAGVMKVSPDRHKIVSQVCEGSSTHGTELFDFDATTGIVSNCQVLDNIGNNYGAEFSPNSTKLYTSTLYGTEVYQYNVSLPTTAAIVASKTLVGTTANAGDLKLAPDNKIYIVKYFVGNLDCITSPDLAGTSCNYVVNSFTLAPGTYGELGLPNIELNVSATDTNYTHHDTSTCILPLSSITITAHDTGTGSSYLWNDGVTITETKTVTTPGIYWVKIYNGCSLLEDTIKVSSHIDTVIIHQDTSLCVPGDNYIMLLHPPSGTHYVWYNADTTVSDTVRESGTYWVHYQNACTLTLDTMRVNYMLIPGPISAPDTVCPGRTVICNDGSGGGHWYSSEPAISKIDSNTGSLKGMSLGTSTITYMEPTGCYITKRITINDQPCRTGIDQLASSVNDIPDVYPNPAGNEISIRFNAPAIRSFSITGSIGQVILKGQLQAQLTTVDVSMLPPGIYYMTIGTDQGNVVKKLVKE